MNKNIYNNIEGHRLLANGTVVEDVTSVTLPNLEHTITSISINGLATDVDFPDPTHMDAMEFTIAHNTGNGAHLLMTPEKLDIELRLVRQKYTVTQASIGHDSVKYRLTCLHKGRENGTVERGNPLGKTDKYSVIRFEEEIGGETTVLVDVMANIIRYGGKDYSSVIENMLN